MGPPRGGRKKGERKKAAGLGHWIFGDVDLRVPSWSTTAGVVRPPCLGCSSKTGLSYGGGSRDDHLGCCAHRKSKKHRQVFFRLFKKNFYGRKNEIFFEERTVYACN